MRQYYFTDKLLLGLVITNLWILIPALWGAWGEWIFFHAAQGNTGPILTSILLSTAEGLLIIGFTTFAFLKRWRWVVIFYVLYLSRTISITIYILLDAWKKHEGLNFLDTLLISYSKAFLWLLALVTLMVMIIETDYKNLFNRWRGPFIQG